MPYLFVIVFVETPILLICAFIPALSSSLFTRQATVSSADHIGFVEPEIILVTYPELSSLVPLHPKSHTHTNMVSHKPMNLPSNWGLETSPSHLN